MDNSRFSSIISSLQLRDIDNMPAHAGSCNKAPLPEWRLQLLPINRSLLLLLSSPVYACNPSTVECAIQIRGNHLPVVIQLAYNCWALCPWYTRVGNEDIEAAVEFSDYGFDRSGDCFEGGNVDLVCFTCSTFLVSLCAPIRSRPAGSVFCLNGGRTLHTVGFLDILGLCDGFLVAVVPDCYVGSSFGECVCYCQANASTSTRDNSCASFERKEWEDAVRDRSNSVIVGEIPTSHGAVHLERWCIGSTRQRSCRSGCRPSQMFKLKLYSKVNVEKREEPFIEEGRCETVKQTTKVGLVILTSCCRYKVSVSGRGMQACSHLLDLGVSNHEKPQGRCRPMAGSMMEG